jgi:hypothetical protein
VDDIFIHPRDNDLIFATHGRSISIMDDITPLSQLTETVLSSALTLFDMRPGIPYRIHYNKARPGNAFYVAPNPDYGASINYYLKARAAESVKITITDSAGQVVRQLTGPAEEGINRIAWDLRWTPPVGSESQGDAGGEEGGLNNRGTQGPLAIPGEYTVAVQSGSLQASKKISVEEDPRIQISESDRRAQFDSLLTLSKLYSAADGSQRALADLRTQITQISRSLQNQSVPANVKSGLDGASKQITDLIATLWGVGGFGGASQVLIPRLNRLIGAIDGYTARPTAGQQEQIQALSTELKTIQAQVNKFLETDIPNLNKQMTDSKIPFIRPNPKPR